MISTGKAAGLDVSWFTEDSTPSVTALSDGFELTGATLVGTESRVFPGLGTGFSSLPDWFVSDT